MRHVRIFLLAGCALLLATAASAQSLNILLTNDDGFDSAGIQAVRSALIGAGHSVTVVAPATQQSGKGGGSTIDAAVFYTEEEPGVWSVAGTPADSVRVGLDIIMAGSPPDLVVSGANEGQNVGQDVVPASGTVNAALVAMQRGIPSIAVSLGLNLIICGGPGGIAGCTAVLHQYDDEAADFTVRLIDEIQAKSEGPGVLPPGAMLNVNIPTPYEPCDPGAAPFPAFCVKDVVATRLGSNGDFSFGFEVLAPGIAVPDFTTHVPSDFCVGTLFAPPTTDSVAQWCGFISVTRLDGDWTAGEKLSSVTKDFGIDKVDVFP
jgi:5'/3'-nucleotidase SurE